MLWEEDKTEKPAHRGNLIDISFALECPRLPLDHAWALSESVLAALPWLQDEQQAGIHLIHGAESGNGWMRPEDVANELLHLSHRTRLSLRVPIQRAEDARKLTGQVLDIAGYKLCVGKARDKQLSTQSTLFCRYIVREAGDNEEQFLEQVIETIRGYGIDLRKILCGRTHVFATPQGPIHTRSAMVAELNPAESLKLQQEGIGPGRKMGFGLFIPHKGIEAVNKLDDD